MRLHRMTSNVGIVAHVRVVEVCDAFLVRRGVVGRRVDSRSYLRAHAGSWRAEISL